MDIYSEQKRLSFKVNQEIDKQRSLTGGLFEKAKEKIENRLSPIPNFDNKLGSFWRERMGIRR